MIVLATIVLATFCGRADPCHSANGSPQGEHHPQIQRILQRARGCFLVCGIYEGMAKEEVDRIVGTDHFRLQCTWIMADNCALSCDYCLQGISILFLRD